MKKKPCQIRDDHAAALREILEIWRNPQCLHTCRWGNKTIEICTGALEQTSVQREEYDDKNK